MTPHDITQRIWAELRSAGTDKHHAWRNPVLATVDAGGQACARTVVLRAADSHQQHLTFFTDQRSPKVRQLQQSNRAALVFWSAALQWQLRASVHITVQTAGTQVDAAWNRLQKSAAAADYLRVALPGAPLAPAPDQTSADPSSTHYLCLLVAKVVELDWLELAPQGHRRLRIQDAHTEWLVP